MAALLALVGGTAVADSGTHAAMATQVAASVTSGHPGWNYGHYGHYGHHGHHGYPGPNVGVYLGYRPPVVYAPPPVIYAPPPAPVVVPAPMVAPAPYYYPPAPSTSFYYRGPGIGVGISF